MTPKKIEINTSEISPHQKKIIIDLDDFFSQSDDAESFSKFLSNLLKDMNENNFLLFFVVNQNYDDYKREIVLENSITHEVDLSHSDDLNAHNEEELSCEKLNLINFGTKIKLEKILQIKKWSKTYDLKIIPKTAFFLFNYEDLDFTEFWNQHTYLFHKNNAIYFSNNPNKIEQIFFSNHFTVFTPLSNNSDDDETSDEKAAKKVANCLIEGPYDSWNFDRINYEFISYLESDEEVPEAI